MMDGFCLDMAAWAELRMWVIWNEDLVQIQRDRLS